MDEDKIDVLRPLRDSLVKDALPLIRHSRDQLSGDFLRGRVQ